MGISTLLRKSTRDEIIRVSVCSGFSLGPASNGVERLVLWEMTLCKWKVKAFLGVYDLLPLLCGKDVIEILSIC